MRRRSTGLASLFLLVLTVLATLCQAGEGRARAQGRLERIKHEILPAVAELRGLPFTEEVKLKIVTPEDVREHVRKAYDRSATADEIRAQEIALVHMGLLEPGTDLKKLLISVYGDQVAGFYDPETKSLSVVETASMPVAADAITIAHELTHALQDQHFRIARFDTASRGNDDLALALMALSEGDANDVMMRYATRFYPRGAGPAIDYSPFISLGMGTESMPSLPMVVNQNLTFPYKYGSRFFTELMKRGGEKAVDAAFSRPPLSTEQVMNPAKYFSYDEPYIVQMPDSSSRLDQGWKLLDQMPLGQFNLGLYLSNSLGNYGLDEIIAPWKGDGIAVYGGPGDGEYIFAFCTLWDSEAAAHDFAQAYERLLDARLPDAVKATAAGGACTYKTDGLLYCLRRKGKMVVTLEHVAEANAAVMLVDLFSAKATAITDLPAVDKD